MAIEGQDFFRPSSQPATARTDTSEMIFRAAQLSMEKRERQRQAIQGVVNTFLTVAQLNQKRARDDAAALQSKAMLGLQRESTQLQRDKFEADETERVSDRIFRHDESEDRLRRLEIDEAKQAETVRHNKALEAAKGLKPSVQTQKLVIERGELAQTAVKVSKALRVIRERLPQGLGLRKITVAGLENLRAKMGSRDPELATAMGVIAGSASRLSRLKGETGNLTDKDKDDAVEDIFGKGALSIFINRNVADAKIANFEGDSKRALALMDAQIEFSKSGVISPLLKGPQLPASLSFEERQRAVQEELRRRQGR